MLPSSALFTADSLPLIENKLLLFFQKSFDSNFFEKGVERFLNHQQILWSQYYKTF
jgi:hypothetical protein